MTPHDPWREISAARLPAENLAALAPVRNQPNVRVHPDGEAVWVSWPAGQSEVARCLLPVPGVAFFVSRGGLWFRFGRRLPASERPPNVAGLPVAAVLVPAKFEPTAPPSLLPTPAALGIARGGEPKPATALTCPVADLVAWADGATTAELAAVRGAHSASRVILLGASRVSIPGAVRYWGEDVLVPLGYRLVPELGEGAIRAAAGAAEGELLLLDEGGAEVIPRAAFAPLTRAGVRLGARRS